jgi:hypothetical protein
MVENNDHSKVFDIMDRMLESILVNEPRIRALEFRVTVMWYIMCAIGAGIGSTLTTLFIWWVQKLW